MPIKPGKDETQSEWMHRCVPEMMGDGKREQEQAVAACMQMWRDKDKSARAYDCPPPEIDEDYEDYMARCQEEGYDQEDCQLTWDDSEEAGNEELSARDPVLHKTHSGTVNGFEFVLSDDTVERMNDVVSSDGWEITTFRRNPIALFSHRADFPIGKWNNLRVEKGALRGRLELAPKGTSKRIDEIRKPVEGGILQAVSFGFRPIDHEPINAKDPFAGTRFLKQELVETSLVSVPANPNALAVAQHVDIRPA